MEGRASEPPRSVCLPRHHRASDVCRESRVARAHQDERYVREGVREAKGSAEGGREGETIVDNTLLLITKDDSASAARSGQ